MKIVYYMPSRGDFVLVRDGDGEPWCVRVFYMKNCKAYMVQSHNGFLAFCSQMMPLTPDTCFYAGSSAVPDDVRYVYSHFCEMREKMAELEAEKALAGEPGQAEES